jgi:hypothetical protein
MVYEGNRNALQHPRRLGRSQPLLDLRYRQPDEIMIEFGADSLPQRGRIAGASRRVAADGRVPGARLI